MKGIFEAEDAIVGIACGLLLLGYAGKFFTLKLPNFVYVMAFAIFIIFILLDLINEFSDLARHFFFVGGAILHNIVDLVISLTFISFFSGWNIPYITQYLVPYLQNPSIIPGLGMFLVIANLIWLFIFPFAS